MVDTDKMQYGFMLGRGTVDVVFVLRKLSEKFRAKNKLLFVFADLYLYLLAFDQLPREDNCFALRRNGVQEYMIHGFMSLYKGCQTTASVDGELSSSFSLKVGVHQVSALSPLLLSW